MLNVTSNHGRILVERQCTLYNVVDVDSVNTLGLRRDLWYCGSGIWYYGDAAVIMSRCVCIDTYIDRYFKYNQATVENLK